jgi:hypothetical protein
MILVHRPASVPCALTNLQIVLPPGYLYPCWTDVSQVISKLLYPVLSGCCPLPLLRLICASLVFVPGLVPLKVRASGNLDFLLLFPAGLQVIGWPGDTTSLCRRAIVGPSDSPGASHWWDCSSPGTG